MTHCPLPACSGPGAASRAGCRRCQPCRRFACGYYGFRRHGYLGRSCLRLRGESPRASGMRKRWGGPSCRPGDRWRCYWTRPASKTDAALPSARRSAVRQVVPCSVPSAPAHSAAKCRGKQGGKEVSTSCRSTRARANLRCQHLGQRAAKLTLDGIGYRTHRLRHERGNGHVEHQG